MPPQTRSTDLGQELRRPGRADPVCVGLSESQPSPEQGKVRAATRAGLQGGETMCVRGQQDRGYSKHSGLLSRQGKWGHPPA